MARSQIERFVSARRGLRNHPQRIAGEGGFREDGHMTGAIAHERRWLVCALRAPSLFPAARSGRDDSWPAIRGHDRPVAA